MIRWVFGCPIGIQIGLLKVLAAMLRRTAVGPFRQPAAFERSAPGFSACLGLQAKLGGIARRPTRLNPHAYWSPLTAHS